MEEEEEEFFNYSVEYFFFFYFFIFFFHIGAAGVIGTEAEVFCHVGFFFKEREKKNNKRIKKTHTRSTTAMRKKQTN